MMSHLVAGYGAHVGGWPWFPFFPLAFLLVWVAIFLLVGRRWRHHPRRTGESVLAERYARGEIDEDEYCRRQQTLRQTSRG